MLSGPSSTPDTFRLGQDRTHQAQIALERLIEHHRAEAAPGMLTAQALDVAQADQDGKHRPRGLLEGALGRRLADGEHHIGAAEQRRIDVPVSETGRREPMDPRRERGIQGIDEALAAAFGLGKQHRHLHRAGRVCAKAEQHDEHDPQGDPQPSATACATRQPHALASPSDTHAEEEVRLVAELAFVEIGVTPLEAQRGERDLVVRAGRAEAARDAEVETIGARHDVAAVHPVVEAVMVVAEAGLPASGKVLDQQQRGSRVRGAVGNVTVTVRLAAIDTDEGLGRGPPGPQPGLRQSRVNSAPVMRKSLTFRK